jgi:formylmethanofuran dehydrogenase subunit B
MIWKALPHGLGRVNFRRSKMVNQHKSTEWDEALHAGNHILINSHARGTYGKEKKRTSNTEFSICIQGSQYTGIQFPQ